MLQHKDDPQLTITSIIIENHDSKCEKQKEQTIDTMPTTRNRNQTMKNQQQQAAMHRKSISKSKIPLSQSLSERKKSERSKQVETLQSFPAAKINQRNSRKRDRKRSFSASQVSVVRCKFMIPLPALGTTSFVTLLTLIFMETVLLSTMSSCAKTFYMHWNTSNSM